MMEGSANDCSLLRLVVPFKVPKEPKRYMMPHTYSQLPKALCGVLVGSIYAGLIMLFHLTSFLPLLATLPSFDALLSALSA